MNLNKNIIYFSIIIILFLLIAIYFYTKKSENNIVIGPVFNSILSGNNYSYNRAKPKRAIKYVDFRDDTNAAFKNIQYKASNPQHDSLNDLSNPANNPTF